MLCKFDLNEFWTKRVAVRQQSANSRLREVASILTELLRVSAYSPVYKLYILYYIMILIFDTAKFEDFDIKNIIRFSGSCLSKYR